MKHPGYKPLLLNGSVLLEFNPSLESLRGFHYPEREK
jgi:hypothetical protein